MNLVESAVLVLHLLAAIAVCGFVLLQHGKGADMGAAFGGGSSGSLFGASGTANFLSRSTAVLATVFFLTSALLTLVFCLGAVLFYVLLHRSSIVPRWITLWGFVGIPLYAAAYLLAMYDVIGGNSSAQNLLQLPLGVQEMALAVWM